MHHISFTKFGLQPHIGVTYGGRPMRFPCLATSYGLSHDRLLCPFAHAVVTIFAAGLTASNAAGWQEQIKALGYPIVIIDHDRSIPGDLWIPSNDPSAGPEPSRSLSG